MYFENKLKCLCRTANGYSVCFYHNNNLNNVFLLIVYIILRITNKCLKSIRNTALNNFKKYIFILNNILMKYFTQNTTPR